MRFWIALGGCLALVLSMAWGVPSSVEANGGHAHIGADAFPRTVLMEQFTAIWCGPCKLADPAADDVVAENEGRVVHLRYHFEDELDTAETLERAYDHYTIDQVGGAGTVPYVVVDGLETKKGASTRDAAYADYDAKVDGRLAEPSPVALEASLEVTATEVRVEVAAAATPAARGQALTLRVVIHESDIQEGGQENDLVTRALHTVPVTLTADVHFETVVVPWNASWAADKLGAAVFLQEGDAGEVYQAAGGTLTDLAAPAAAVTSHGEGDTVHGEAIELSGFAVAATGTPTVEVRLDGGSWEAAEGSSEWTYTIEALEDGDHTVEVRTYDGAAYSAPWSVTLDADVPTPTTPAPGVVVLVALFVVLSWVAARRRRLRET
jgi:thiol-disulfide isomerase/thioredoxin